MNEMDSLLMKISGIFSISSISTADFKKVILKNVDD